MNFYDTRLRGLAFTNCTVVLYHIHKFSLKMRCSKANRPSVYPLRELPFEDGTLPFPNHLEQLLTKMYGDYMTPPPVEKRKTHFPYELDFGPYAPDKID